MRSIFYALTLSMATHTVLAEPSRDEAYVLQISGTSLRIERPVSSLEYVYTVKTPFFELNGTDGVINPDRSKGLKPFSDEQLSIEDFARFSFFSKEPTTIGFLQGRAGATGWSSQMLTLIDTSTGKQVQVELTNMESPKWIIQEGTIIGVEKMRWDSLGWGSLSLGLAPRLDRCVLFDKGADGAAMTKSIHQSRFKEAALEENEISELQKPLSEIDRKAGRKFLDRIYYGTWLGKDREVADLLGRVGDQLRVEAESFIRGLNGPVLTTVSGLQG